MISNIIENIVFYPSENEGELQAVIFYKDGSIKNVFFDEAISICEEYAREMNITSKDSFNELVNSNFVHVLSVNEFEKRFNSFRATKPATDFDSGVTQDVLEQEIVSVNDDEDVVSKYDLESISLPKTDIQTSDTETTSETSEDYDLDDDIDTTGSEKNEQADPDFIIGDIYSDEYEDDEPRKGFFGRAFDKTKKVVGNIFDKAKKNRKNISLKATAIMMTLAIAFGLASCEPKKSSKGDINNNSISSTDTNDDDNLLVHDNNSYYDNYTLEELFTVTNGEFQKSAMTKLYNAIRAFNVGFANAYVEDGKKIKPALSFDEVVALQNAYNNFSKDEIKMYFNGADINADDLIKNYKSASLQLMGAYVIETKENPLDMSVLINDQEGVAFYNKYHKMFLDAKYAKGDEQNTLVEKFYNSVREDFPISKEVRTEGISHADSYDKIESYKLSVAPMIAAAEMLFQNLDVDVTLKDGEIDFLNDIGLCNYADDKFERIQTIVLSSSTDNTNPLYDQYRESIIGTITDLDAYAIDDEYRELSELDTFKLAVNGHFDQVITGPFRCNVSSSSYTFSSTTYSETVTRQEKNIPGNIKKEIDNAIADDNAVSRIDGEREAEKNRSRMQSEADNDAKKINNDVQEDANDMQSKIDSANGEIKNGQTVNENDFGDHNVKFNDEHSNGNGNLAGSVENITTDSKGDQTNQPLPDPNETGAEFDKKVSSPTGSNNVDNINSGDGYWEEVGDTISGHREWSEISGVKYFGSDEQLVDYYVDYLASIGNDEDAIQYTK